MSVTHLKLSCVGELLVEFVLALSAVSMSVVSAVSVAVAAAVCAVTGDEAVELGVQGVYATLLCCGSRRRRMSCMAPVPCGLFTASVRGRERRGRSIERECE